MIWEGAEPLMARLGRWRPRGWIEHDGGGLQVCHTPDKGAHAYLHWVFPGLPEERLVQTEAAYDRPLPAEYRRFLGWANGARFFGHLALRGSHIRGTDRDSLDRSGVGIGQPVSLDYGNPIGRPIGAPVTAWVIGSVSGWSGQGSLLLNQAGEVRLCSNADAGDVAAVWGSFGEMLLQEFDRMNDLVGDRGEPLVDYVEFLPEGGRRWETSREKRRSLKDLFRRKGPAH